MSPARLLFDLLAGHRAGLAAIVPLAVLEAATVSAYAWLAGPLLTALLAGQGSARGQALGGGLEPLLSLPPDRMWPVAGALIAGVAIARGLATLGLGAVVSDTQQRVMHDLRMRVYRSLVRLRSHGEERIGGREAGVRLTNDVGGVAQLFGLGAITGARNTLTTLGLLAVAASADLGITALAGVAIVLGAWGTSRASRAARALWRVVLGRQTALGTAAAEVVAHAPVLRSYDAMFAAEQGIVVRSEEVRGSAQRAAVVGSATRAAIMTIGGASLGAAVAAAGHRLSSGALTSVEAATLFTAAALLYRPIQSLGSASTSWTQGYAALERTAALLVREASPDSVERPATGVSDPARSRARGAVSFRGVRFSFPGCQVLDGVDLAISVGESVAIVGRSGAGKTTLLAILLGELEPQAGSVALDGVDHRTVDSAWWRMQIAWVPQEPFLLATSIRNNIALGDNPPDDARIVAAARRAEIHDRIERLPAGYATEVGEDGAGLSVGERQRICIARALYRNAPILLLDEPTSALDEPAARALSTTIETLFADRTVLLVSHRETMIRAASRVVALSGGRIVLQENR